MIPFLHSLIFLLLVAFFFYVKLHPYRLRLYPPYSRIFDVLDRLFSTLLNGLRKLIKPVVIGQNLSMDMSQFIVFILLLLLLQITQR